MAAKAGDNSKKLEEQRKVLFFDHCSKRMAIDAKLAELREDRKKATGLAKADGIAAKSLDFAITAMTAQDEQAFVDGYIHNGEILEWCGMFPGFQSDLLRDRMPADERIDKAGELAGLTNRPRESGYAADSRETQIWLKAYDRARKSSADNLANAMEAAEKARQKGTAATKKKAAKSKAGAPLTGDTPDSAKSADNDDQRRATLRHQEPLGLEDPQREPGRRTNPRHPCARRTERQRQAERA